MTAQVTFSIISLRPFASEVESHPKITPGLLSHPLLIGLAMRTRMPNYAGDRDLQNIGETPRILAIGITLTCKGSKQLGGETGSF